MKLRMLATQGKGDARGPSPRPSLSPLALAQARKRTRLAIVDDSKSMRQILKQIFDADPEIEIVGSFSRPQELLDALPTLKPDVITLDIHMPEMNGIDLLKTYLPKFPIPTILISSLRQEDGPEVLQGLEIGAVDYLEKPGAAEIPLISRIWQDKIKTAALARVRKGQERRTSHGGSSAYAIDQSALVLLGASTGGTEALKDVLVGLPANVPPILIVQHIPPVFSKAFAERLSQLCAFPVYEAQDGMPVRPGAAWVAPGGKQMRIVEAAPGDLRVKIDDSAPVNRHKPSVDVLFESALEIKSRRKIAAILTGMGTDGAKGILRLRNEAQAKTIAQDEASSVVFGMPREAIRIGGAEQIVALQDISKVLLLMLTAKSAPTIPGTDSDRRRTA